MKLLRGRKRTSIRGKLTRSFVFLSGTSVLLVCICFLSYDTLKNREALSQQVAAVASVIRHNSAATLLFEDADGAERILSALEAQQEVRVACLFSSSNTLLAKYPADTPDECETPRPSMPETSYGRDELRVFQSVELDGEIVGSLVVHRRLDDLRQHLVDRFYISGVIFVFALLASLLMATPLQRFLVDPILHLVDVARKVTSDDVYSLRASQKSNDELGDLTVALNEMLERIETRDRQLEEHRNNLETEIHLRTIELRDSNSSLLGINQQLEDEMEERENAQKEREELHRQLVEASREAGMAEVATGVLHNVGNVLNSVNVGIELLREKVHNSKVSGLTRVMALANEHSDDPARFVAEHPKGQKIFPYLTRLGQSLENENKRMVEELDNVQKSVNHINDIVATQQDFARSSAVTETASPSGIIEEAIRINREGLGQSKVEIVREFEPMPDMILDRHRVLQILVNMFRNAQQAFDEVEQDDKVLTIRLQTTEDKIRIELEDNGPGIEAENLTRIFSHGFTTKKTGHGFGLHSCATSAMEMRGSLTVRSDGRGCGATFMLELPKVLPGQLGKSQDNSD